MTTRPKTPEEMFEAVKDVFTNDWWPEFGPGWYHLVVQMAEEMRPLLPPGVTLRMVQAKEKFGGMRVYYDIQYDYEPSVDELCDDSLSYRLDEVCQKYEYESTHTCIACGQPGELRAKGWIEPLCDEHYKKETHHA